MKNQIVENGFLRFKRGQRKLTLEDLHQKYAKEISKATPQRKQIILEKIFAEFDRQKNHKPSAGALY